MANLGLGEFWYEGLRSQGGVWLYVERKLIEFFFWFWIHPSVFSSLMKKLWDMGPSLILRSNFAMQMSMQNLLGNGGFFHGFRV
jgi:hypothetical protein